MKVLSAQRKFELVRRDGSCLECRQWLRRRTSLKAAWAACQRPAWLLFWLSQYADVDLHELRNRYAAKMGGICLTYKQDDRDLCDEIRRTYSYTGRRLA